MTRSKIYVGIYNGTRERFSSVTTPTEQTYPWYSAVIGPFKTVRGADYCVKHAYSICQSVASFERAASIELDNVKRAYENHEKVYGKT